MKAENSVRDYIKMKGAKKKKDDVYKRERIRGGGGGVRHERHFETLLLKCSKSHAEYFRLLDVGASLQKDYRFV